MAEWLERRALQSISGAGSNLARGLPFRPTFSGEYIPIKSIYAEIYTAREPIRLQDSDD